MWLVSGSSSVRCYLFCRWIDTWTWFVCNGV